MTSRLISEMCGFKYTPVNVNAADKNLIGKVAKLADDFNIIESANQCTSSRKFNHSPCFLIT
jgi:hypothetical protein